jgi:hypothetical protein
MKICEKIQVWLKSDKNSRNLLDDLSTFFVAAGDIKSPQKRSLRMKSYQDARSSVSLSECSGVAPAEQFM